MAAKKSPAKVRGVYEREQGSGIWWIRYEVEGKPRREKVGRRSDAVALYQKRKADLIAIGRGDISTVRIGCSPLTDHVLFNDFCQMHKEFLPNCQIRPERDDTTQLIKEVLAGTIDAAIVTLPVNNGALRVEELKRDRLVICLRKDSSLAAKSSLLPTQI
jgi:DNA-binding transcriptional LysR family regulator